MIEFLSEFPPEWAMELTAENRQPPWSATNRRPQRKMECGECNALGYNPNNGQECDTCDGKGYWMIPSPQCGTCGTDIEWEDGVECVTCETWYCNDHYDSDKDECLACRAAVEAGFGERAPNFMFHHAESFSHKNCATCNKPLNWKGGRHKLDTSGSEGGAGGGKGALCDSCFTNPQFSADETHEDRGWQTHVLSPGSSMPPEVIKTVRLPAEHGGTIVNVLAYKERGGWIYYLLDNNSPNLSVDTGTEILWANLKGTWEELRAEDIDTYRGKRKAPTPEPGAPGTSKKGTGAPMKVQGVSVYSVQEHHAEKRGPHRDIRIGYDDATHGPVLLSFVPTGGLDNKIPTKVGRNDKITVIQTEDHPFDYWHFEGSIPSGSYGAGPVSLETYGKSNIISYEPGKKLKVEFTGGKYPGKYVFIHYRGKVWGMWRYE